VIVLFTSPLLFSRTPVSCWHTFFFFVVVVHTTAIDRPSTSFADDFFLQPRKWLLPPCLPSSFFFHGVPVSLRAVFSHFLFDPTFPFAVTSLSRVHQRFDTYFLLPPRSRSNPSLPRAPSRSGDWMRGFQPPFPTFRLSLMTSLASESVVPVLASKFPFKPWPLFPPTPP